MKEQYKDTDLREALRRKYSDTPKLPADFMEKMARQTAPKSRHVIKTRHAVMAVLAVAASILLAVLIVPRHQSSPDMSLAPTPHVAQGPRPTYPDTPDPRTSEPSTHVAPTVRTGKTVSPSPTDSEFVPDGPKTTIEESRPQTVTLAPVADTHLHYASQSLTDDSTYQAPSRMNDFITKIAEYNKVKAVPLNCTSDKGDSTVVNKAYVFEDTQELDLFARLLQAACWYDSSTPGYLLNFSHQQFFFTLKDLRKGEKYLWIAERIDRRILLFSAQSPIETNVSSACYQNYREQLTHINMSTLDF